MIRIYVICILIYFLQGCSILSGNLFDREDDPLLDLEAQEVSNLSDVVFPTALCYDEKRYLWNQYEEWASCSDKIVSSVETNPECLESHKKWKSSAELYSECRKAYLEDRLLINPFHLFRK